MSRVLIDIAVGPRGSFYVPQRRFSNEFGTLANVEWNGDPLLFTYGKGFMPRLSGLALAPEDTMTFEHWAWTPEDIDVVAATGASNGEGPWNVDEFEAWATRYVAQFGLTLPLVKLLIGATSGSWLGGNTTGAGVKAIIGPAQVFAVMHVCRRRKPVCLVDLATGTSSIDNQWGTNGNDGVYALQRDHLNTYGGLVGGYVTTNRVFRIHAQGEHDTHLTTHASQPNHWRPTSVNLVNKSRTDLPNAPTVANLIFALAPQPWTTGQSWLDFIIANQLSFHDPLGAEFGGVPTWVRQYRSIDWIPGDAPHIGGNIEGTIGWPYHVGLWYADLIAAGLV